MTERENFAGLVSASAERVRYKAGDVILKEGDHGDRMFVLTSGRALITIRNQLLETVEEGGVFGEMALVDAGPRGASVAAQTDCEAVPVDVPRFEFMVRHTPLFALQLMRVMCRRLRAMNTRGLLSEEA
jgi:CRP/FNR family cyclic AMP-dependent transcriptional regulator